MFFFGFKLFVVLAHRITVMSSSFVIITIHNFTIIFCKNVLLVKEGSNLQKEKDKNLGYVFLFRNIVSS